MNVNRDNEVLAQDDGNDAVENAPATPYRFNTIHNEMNEAEVASILARELSSNEFEFLVRERIRLRMKELHTRNPNLRESHDHVTMNWHAENPTTWRVTAGETYSKTTSEEGEVLSITFEDMEARHYRKERNKLLLFPSSAPKSDTPF